MKKITPELLEKYYRGSCTEEEQKLVEAWLNSEEPKSPLEEKYLATSWQKIRDKTQSEKPPVPIRKRSPYSRLIRIAASVILLASVSIFFYRDFVGETYNSSDSSEISYRTISTQRGQKRTINLPDGSTIRLNYESQLKIPKKFADSARTVFLSGHAHFEVARDPDRPFIIYTDYSKTQVLGTSFDIRTNENSSETEVVVTSGQVEFSEKAEVRNKVTLTVNNRAVLQPDQKINVSEVNAQNLTAWKDNRLLFDNESLEEIIQVLEPWYDVEVTVKDPTLLSGIYKFSYDNPPLETLMERMSFMAKFEYTIEGKFVTIY
ncbi:MAG: FecR domain-containing protein [Bacteroidota bacterium]